MNTKKTVLLIDDSQKFREMLVKVLERMDLAVTAASSFEEGKAAIEGPQPFDIVMSDFELGANRFGTELLELAEKLRPQAQRLLMSGGCSEPAGHNAVHFFSKPFPIAELLPYLQAA